MVRGVLRTGAQWYQGLEERLEWKGWRGGGGFELHGLFCLGLSFSAYRMGGDHLHDLLP